MDKNILLIDDDEDDHLIFKEALSQVGIPANCICASSAQDGIKLLDDVSPDYIFLDVNMPALNGLQCLEMIKKDQRLSKIRVVMYSTGLDDVICDKAFQRGAFACIKKISSIKDLAKMLNRFFEL